MKPDDIAGQIRGRVSSALRPVESEPPARPFASVIGDHELLAKIGVGSYGEVWLGRGTTGQLRAIKLVRRDRFASDRPFVREFNGILRFEPISRSHPGVVGILHVGRDEGAGYFFYVMELADALGIAGTDVGTSADNPGVGTRQAVSGRPGFSPGEYRPRTLASELRMRGRLPIPEVLRLGAHLADALDHLHRNELVHRDVKPSNVIFVGGQPKLADIGLVTSVGDARSFVGTEGFIPPEGPGTASADLFALGRLLYEAATSKDRSDYPHLPEDLERWPESERVALLELNEVLAKMCAPDAALRHKHAAEVVGDLNLLLAGRSVRRVYGMERRLRYAKRTSVAALIAAVLALGAVGFERARKRQAEVLVAHESALRERAETAEREARQQLHAALHEQARATILGGELGHRTRALEAVGRAAAISNSAGLRGVAVAAMGLPDLRLEREWQAEPGVTFLQLDPSFERVAIGRGRRAVEIRSTRDHQVLVSLPGNTNRQAFHAIWSPDGRALAVKRDVGPESPLASVEVWDVGKAQCLHVFDEVVQNAMTFHPARPLLMVGLHSSELVIWNWETGQETERKQVPEIPVRLKFAPDGESFGLTHSRGSITVPASSEPGTGMTMAVYRLADLAPRIAREFPDLLLDFDWHPSGRWIAMAAGYSGEISVMNTSSGETRLLGRHKAQAVQTVFSPDGYLFSGGWDREVICWDVNSMRRVMGIALDSYRIQLSADGMKCAIFRWPEGRIRYHAVEQSGSIREMDGELGGGLHYAAISPGGRWLAVSGVDQLAVWDLDRKAFPTLIRVASSTRPAFAPDGELLATRAGMLLGWRLRAGDQASEGPRIEPIEFAAHKGLHTVCVSSNGLILTGTRGSKHAELDPERIFDGSWSPTIPGLNTVSPDGRWLGVVGSFSPNVHVYRLPDFEAVAILTNQFNVARFEFSPNGDEMAVACRQGVEFWSTRTWQRTRRIADSNKVLYSADGSSVWLGENFRTAALHDARTGGLLLPVPPGFMPWRQVRTVVDSS